MTTTASIAIKYSLKSILFCIAFTVVLMLMSFAKTFAPPQYERMAYGIIGMIAAFLTTIVFLKFDKKQFADIGLTAERKTITRFIAGMFTGVILMGTMAMSVIYFSQMTVSINPRSNFLHFLLMTTPLIPLAFMEELGFRAYPLEILKDKAGITNTILLTSILFALYHILNGWTVVNAFLGAGVWGLIFGLAAVYSKGIAMPTGIHYAINLTTSALGDADNTVSIWVVKITGIGPSKPHHDYDAATVLPSLALLVFAIICFRLLIKRKTS